MNGKKYLLILICLFTWNIYSQVELAEIQQIAAFSTENEFVTTPAKRQQSIKESFAEVIVITSAEIRLTGARNLTDLFRNYSEINIAETEYASWDAGLRGLTDNRHYSLEINGVPYSGRDWNPVWLQSLPVTLKDIERIEILKGPQTVFHGDNAISGVINIITSSAQDKSGGLFSYNSGERAYSDASLALYGGISDTAVSLHLANKQSDRWSEDISIGETFVVTARADHNIDSETVLGVDINYTRSDENDLTQIIRNTFDTKDYNLVFSLQGLDFQAYASFLKRTVSGNPLLMPGYTPHTLATELEENIVNIEIFKNFSFLGGTATIGANYDLNDSQVDVDGHPNSSEDSGLISLFISEQTKLSDILSLYAGLKYKKHTELDSLLDWELAMNYKSFDDILIKCRLSSGSKLPTNEELLSFSPDFTRGDFFWIVGNRELDEERIYSAECSADFYLTKDLKFTGSVYTHELKNIIKRTSQPVPSEQNAFTSVNALDMRLFGIDISLKYTYSSGNIFINYTHTVTDRDDWSKKDTVPGEKINAGFIHNFRNGISLFTAVHFVSDYDVVETLSAYIPQGYYSIDSYLTIDAALTVAWNENIDLSLAAANILNEEHHEDYLGEEIGRRITASVSLAF